jgi:hypothetical protein
MVLHHCSPKIKKGVAFEVFTICGCVSRDSSVGIATGYGLDDQGGWEFESRQGQKFSLLHIVQTGSGVHPTSYKMGTGGSSRG